jgi:hypothetical protein
VFGEASKLLRVSSVSWRRLSVRWPRSWLGPEPVPLLQYMVDLPFSRHYPQVHAVMPANQWYRDVVPDLDAMREEIAS